MSHEAENRARLSEANKMLFDWIASRLKEDPYLWTGMMQAAACYLPSASYWQIVKQCQEVAERPDFQKRIELARKQVEATERTVN